jgi:hypothetical protein
MMGVINAGADAAMPAFGTLLNDQEKRGVVAYYQSMWSDDVYSKWLAGPGREAGSMGSGKQHDHSKGQHSHGGDDHSHDGQHRHSNTVIQR